MAFQQPKSFLLGVLLLAVGYCGTYELQSPMTKLIQKSFQNKQPLNNNNRNSNFPDTFNIQSMKTDLPRPDAAAKAEDDITHSARQYPVTKGAAPSVFMEAMMKKQQQKLSKRHQVPCRASIPLTFSEDEPLPWTCRQRKEWVSLEDSYYPNRLYQTICESPTCWDGHYNCTPVTYSTHVLQLCFNSRCDDQRMPYSLRQVWKFVNLDVTVGCTCTR